MLQIQLYIENDEGVLEEVELYKDESVTLTQSIQDVMDIEKVFTDYSKTFNVPASKKNNKFFKHFYNYFIDGFDARRKKNAEIHLNYKPFKKGKIKLEGAQLKNNEPHTYKLTFFGNTITLKDLIGEDKLGSLTQLDAFDFVYNDTNIEAYMTNGIDASIGGDYIQDGIIIPLITHTDRLIYDSSDTEAGTNNLYYNVIDSNAHGVKFNQLKPALRIYAIIKAIEKKYDLKFSEDFFSTTNASFYNLYMWLHTKEGSMFEDQDAQYTIGGFTDVRGDTSKITGVHSSYFNNSYNESRNKRTIRVKVTPSTNDEYTLVIKQNGEEFKKFSNLTGTTTNGVTNNVPEIEIPNGDYTFFIEGTNASNFTVDVTILNDPDSWLRSKSQITFTGTTSVFTDQNINISSNLPKMKTLDFITGIFKMFNLTSYVDNEGVIVVKTLDSFYDSSKNTWDITKHLDKEESIVDAVIPYRQVNLGYKGTTSFLAQNHEDLANKKWGTLEYRASDKFEGEEYNIELPFEHMKFERLYDLDTGTGTTIQYGWSVDSNQDSTKGEPLVFYASRAIGTIAAVNIAGTRVNIAGPYCPSNSLLLTNLFGTQSQSLNFHSEYDEYSAIPNEKTLFETFYKEYIKGLFDKRKRLTFVSAYLPLTVIESLSLADKIIVFDKLYRINKITTNFETNKSDLELINILEEKIFATSPYALQIDLSSDFITVDTTVYNADLGNLSADGFTLPPETSEVPDEIQGNEIIPPTSDPCEVTPSTISSTRSESYATELLFYGTIGSSGKLCNQYHIDEYGFLLSTDSSYLTASDDIDTLKADSNVEVFSVHRNSFGFATLSVGEKVTTKYGLTHPTTYHARFYVRTNTSDLHAFADTISDVFSRTTTSGDLETAISVKFAGAGNSGYLTQPTLSTIIQNGYDYCDNLETITTIYHNGQNEYPIVGDKIKYLQSNDYTGGGSSLPYDNAINDFGAFAMANNDTIVNGQGRINKHIVFKISTAEVVAVYNCPIDVCDTNLYIAGGSLSATYGMSWPSSIRVGATISGLNEVVGGVTTAANIVGVIYSTTSTTLTATNIQNYLDGKTLPSGTSVALIESDNQDDYGNLTQWDENGLLKNSGIAMIVPASNGTYYAALFIGHCGKFKSISGIVQTSSI